MEKTTFKLERIEDLDPQKRGKISGFDPDMKTGLVIKEYKSGSFVKMTRFLPNNNLFTAQVNTKLTEGDRRFVSEKIKGLLEF